MPLPRGCPPDGTAGVAGADTPLALRWLCGVAPALARHLQVKTVANKRHRGAGQGGSHLRAGVKLRLSGFCPLCFHGRENFSFFLLKECLP